MERLESDDDLVVRTIVCPKADVVYVKSIVSAYDGLCGLFSNKGENIRLVAPRGREAELDQLVKDLVNELDARKCSSRRSESAPRSVAE
jgi:hypothetical protein